MRLIRSDAGFTFLAALFMVVIVGIMLGAVGQSMKSMMQREREKELIFRGMQYRDAIERWSKKGVPLKDLNHLLDPPMSSNINASKDRLIRKLYSDPMTKDGKWKTLPNPPDPIQGIYGVASASDEQPIKTKNFPEAIKGFEGKTKYSEWEFIYKKQPSAVTNAPGQTGKKPANLSMPLSTPEGN